MWPRIITFFLTSAHPQPITFFCVWLKAMYQLVQTFLRQWKNGSCHFDIFMLKIDWLSHIKMIQVNILQIITKNTCVCVWQCEQAWSETAAPQQGRLGCTAVWRSAVSLTFSPCCLFFKCVRLPLFWICDSRLQGKLLLSGTDFMCHQWFLFVSVFLCRFIIYIHTHIYTHTRTYTHALQAWTGLGLTRQRCMQESYSVTLDIRWS